MIKKTYNQIKYNLFDKSTQSLIKSILISHQDKTKYQQYWIKTLLNNVIEHYAYNKNPNVLFSTNQIITTTNDIINQILPINTLIGIQPIDQKIQDNSLHLLHYDKQNDQICLKSTTLNTNQFNNLYGQSVHYDIPPTNKSTLAIAYLNSTAQELASNIIELIINVIIDLTQEHPTNDININYQSIDDCNTLTKELLKQANAIGRDTRRGIGNVILTNPLGVTLLKQNTFLPLIPPQETTYNQLKIAGTLNNITILSYQSLHKTDHVPFIIGYKSNGNQLLKDADAGVFLLPELLFNTDNNIHINSKFKLAFNVTNEITKPFHYYRLVKAHTKDL